MPFAYFGGEKSGTDKGLENVFFSGGFTGGSGKRRG